MTDPIATAADFVRVLQAEVQRHLAAAQLTLPRYAVLHRAAGASAADVAALMGVSPQMVSKTVGQLVLLDYVTSVPADDRRRQLLQLTAMGARALTLARAIDLPPALVTAMTSYVASTPQSNHVDQPVA